MKKITKFLLSMILVLSFGKVFAEEITLTYSEWTTDYPSNIPEVFIQSEDRYHFYKIVDGQVEYDNGYYTELDGYIKDEASARTYYRYITNPYLIFNANNEMVLNTSYCQKSFCYSVKNGTPIMINTLSKFENEYGDDDRPVVDQEIVPFTGDNVMYYIGLLSISVIGLGAIFMVRKSKNKQLNRA